MQDILRNAALRNWFRLMNKNQIASEKCVCAFFFIHLHRHIIRDGFFLSRHETDRYKSDEFPPIILYFIQNVFVCAWFFVPAVYAIKHIKNKSIFKLKNASCCVVLPTIYQSIWSNWNECHLFATTRKAKKTRTNQVNSN